MYCDARRIPDPPIDQTPACDAGKITKKSEICFFDTKNHEKPIDFELL